MEHVHVQHSSIHPSINPSIYSFAYSSILQFNVSLDPNTSLFEAILEVLFIDGQQNRIPIENLNNSKGIYSINNTYYNSLYNNLSAIFYSCPLMGENCGQCLHIQSKFQCGYCPDKASCILGSLCSQTTLMGIDAIGSCERPVILSVRIALNLVLDDILFLL